jgi:predicted helicase
MFYRGGNVHFPLYLYSSAESPDASHQERRPNLAEWLLPKLSTAYGFTPTPEEVLAYIYAVLYSPTYRRVYAEALRSDFPRIPFVAGGGGLSADGGVRAAADRPASFA